MKLQRAGRNDHVRLRKGALRASSLVDLFEFGARADFRPPLDRR